MLFADGSASAQSGDYLYDILSAFGHETGGLPASLVTLLNELSTLF